MLLKIWARSIRRKAKKTSKVGSLVKTPDGEGTVSGVEVLKEPLKVQFKNEDITTYKNYKASDVKVIKSSNNTENTLDSEELENLKELEALEKLEKEELKNIDSDED